jgi:V-type H+-transporting ATPase subunit E
VQAIFAQTSEKLASISSDAGKYGKLLQGILLQSCLGLLETKVNVRARKGDAKAVEGFFGAVAAEYKKLCGLDLTLTMDTKNPLSDGCGGGVEVYVGNGSIKVTNTLETRLEQACNLTLPAIRNTLIGIGNGTRAFFD